MNLFIWKKRKLSKMDLKLAILILVSLKHTVAQINDTLFLNSELLVSKLLTGYNKIVKPPGQINVAVRINVLQVVNVIEKDQVIILNVWINQAWNDQRLSWKPQDYANKTYILIPSDKVWL